MSTSPRASRSSEARAPVASSHPPAIEALIQALKSLPGVGARTAQRSVHPDATVDMQHGAGDEARIGAGQVQDRGGDFLRLAETL